MTTKTDTDAILSAVDPCPDCGGSGLDLRGCPPQPQGGPCWSCKGSGSVRRFPKLWRECYHWVTGDGLSAVQVDTLECEDCSGTSWVFAPTLVSLLNAVPCVHISFDSQEEGRWKCRMVLIAPDGNYGQDVSGEGTNHEEAIKAALAKVALAASGKGD